MWAIICSVSQWYEYWKQKFLTSGNVQNSSKQSFSDGQRLGPSWAIWGGGIPKTIGYYCQPTVFNFFSESDSLAKKMLLIIIPIAYLKQHRWNSHSVCYVSSPLLVSWYLLKSPHLKKFGWEIGLLLILFWDKRFFQSFQLLKVPKFLSSTLGEVQLKRMNYSNIWIASS